MAARGNRQSADVIGLVELASFIERELIGGSVAPVASWQSGAGLSSGRGRLDCRVRFNLVYDCLKASLRVHG